MASPETDDLYRRWQELNRRAEAAKYAAEAQHNRWVKAYITERNARVNGAADDVNDGSTS